MPSVTAFNDDYIVDTYIGLHARTVYVRARERIHTCSSSNPYSEEVGTATGHRRVFKRAFKYVTSAVIYRLRHRRQERQRTCHIRPFRLSVHWHMPYINSPFTGGHMQY